MLLYYRRGTKKLIRGGWMDGGGGEKGEGLRRD